MPEHIEIGSKVRLADTREVGIVIHTWNDDVLQVEDCYVAFFGTEFPVGKPSEKPYVLRYASLSLELVD